MQRRDFLKSAALFALAPSFSAGPARAGIERPRRAVPLDLEESDAFPLGVGSGDVTATSALLWTRHRGDAPLSVVVWPTGNGAPVGAPRARPVRPDAAGFVHARIDGLVPGQPHAYAFVEDDAAGRPRRRSEIGRLVAAPDDAAAPTITLGATCCTNQLFPLTVLERAAARPDLDAFLHLGDAVYCDLAGDLAEMRATWAENLAKPAYRALRASMPLISTWDDHEVGNNWNPETIKGARLKDAWRAFLEHQPMAPGPAGRIWRSRRFGRTVEVFVLDTRSERRPSTRHGKEAQYVSRAQMDWLKAGLSSSPAAFKLVVNTVPITALPQPLDAIRSDRWEGYESQREELLAHVDGAGVEGVMFLAGDLHLGSVGRVSRKGFGRRTLEVLAGPGAQVPNPAVAMFKGSQFDFATGANNYASLRFHPSSGEVDVELFDKAGRALYSERRRLR